MINYDRPRSLYPPSTLPSSTAVTMAAQRLLTALESLSPTSNDSNSPTNGNALLLLSEWSDDLEKDLLASTDTSAEEVEASHAIVNDAASALHHSLLFAAVSSYDFGEEWAVNGDHEMSFKAASLLCDDENNKVNLQLLAALLRATGLFLRWNAQVLQSANVQSSSNPIARFKCKGMLLLYCKLLEVQLPTPTSPDVPRFASICLFRATYGNDSLTVKARTTLVESIDGCEYLMKALMKGDQPASRVFSIVRNVHHLIAAHPTSIGKMDGAVQKITADELPNNEYAQGLLGVLVATLSWALRSEPTFPGDEYDRRPDLVLEILRSLFAMDAGLSSNSSHNKDTMTRIGIILCESLQYPNSDMRVYQCKLAVVALLLNAPDDYSEYLAVNKGIIPLIDIMAYQLSVVVIERTGSSAEDAAAAVPILLVLRKLAQASSSVLKLVQDEVFPPDAEEAFKEKAESEIMKKQSEGTVRAKNMAPLDAPRGTLRWKLIRLMTWTESNVKRSASELLWTLCDEDSTQFVLRTGFGNAIHFLGMKGCVNLPTGVAI